MAEERPIAAAQAAVYFFDQDTTSWQPVDSGVSSVYIYENPATGDFRVVGVTEGGDFVINSVIFPELVYTQSSESFHNWTDTIYVYGLNFAALEDAAQFASTMQYCVSTLKESIQNPVAAPPPPASVLESIRPPEPEPEPEPPKQPDPEPEPEPEPEPPKQPDPEPEPEPEPEPVRPPPKKVKPSAPAPKPEPPKAADPPPDPSPAPPEKKSVVPPKPAASRPKPPAPSPSSKSTASLSRESSASDVTASDPPVTSPKKSSRPPSPRKESEPEKPVAVKEEPKPPTGLRGRGRGGGPHHKPSSTDVTADSSGSKPLNRTPSFTSDHSSSSTPSSSASSIASRFNAAAAAASSSSSSSSHPPPKPASRQPSATSLTAAFSAPHLSDPRLEELKTELLKIFHEELEAAKREIITALTSRS